MQEYQGIYGRGYKNGENLCLEKGNLLLVREKLDSGKYNVGVIDDPQGEAFHLSLLENISLTEWRKFFLESTTKKGISKLKHFMLKFELESTLAC